MLSPPLLISYLSISVIECVSKEMAYRHLKGEYEPQNRCLVNCVHHIYVIWYNIVSLLCDCIWKINEPKYNNIVNYGFFDNCKGPDKLFNKAT
jgi:hypothetical protein